MSVRHLLKGWAMVSVALVDTSAMTVILWAGLITGGWLVHYNLFRLTRPCKAGRGGRPQI
jgi:hypothetical protein